MIIMDYWPLNLSTPKKNYENFLKKFPFILISMFLGSLAIISSNNNIDMIQPLLSFRFYNFLHNISYYAYKIVFPFNLTKVIPQVSVEGFGNFHVLIGCFILIILILTTISSFQKSKKIFYCITITSIMLLPFIGLLNFSPNNSITEHLYLGGIGVLFLINDVFTKAIKKKVLKKGNYLKLISVILGFFVPFSLVYLVYASSVYQTNWIDTIRLNAYFVSLNPNSSLLHYYLGSEYDRNGLLDNAIFSYKKAEQLGNNSTYYALGKVYESLKDNANAAKYYLKVLELNSLELDKKIELAFFIINEGKFEELIPFLEKQNTQLPSNMQILSALVECYLQTNKNTEALSKAKELLFLQNPKDPNLIKIISSLNLQLGKATDAEYYAKEGIKIAAGDPEFEKLLNDATTLNDTLNKLKKSSYSSEDENIMLSSVSEDTTINSQSSLKDIPEAHNEDNNSSDMDLLEQLEQYNSILNEAKVKSENNDFEAAAEILLKLIAAHPNMEDAYISLGVIRLKQEKYSDAEILLKKALELNEFKIFVNHYLGILYTKLKNYKEAEDRFNKHLQYSPNEYSSYLNLGIIYTADHKTDKAIEMFKKALEIHPNYPQAYYNWAQIYISKQDYLEALRLLQKALEIDPLYENAKQDYERLQGLIYP
jgi:tetratricopeptide (TPR) repeat protein